MGRHWLNPPEHIGNAAGAELLGEFGVCLATVEGLPDLSTRYRGEMITLSILQVQGSEPARAFFPKFGGEIADDFIPPIPAVDIDAPFQLYGQLSDLLPDNQA